MDQNTPEWLKMRRNYVGASDSPIIMGTCKFKMADGRKKTPNLLWQEKLGLVELNSITAATRYGHDMEDTARQSYEKMTDELMVPKVVYHSNIPYMMASLDGINLEEDLAVEIKNCSAVDHETARGGTVPLHYYAQVQHQLACTGHEKMHYFSFHKGEGIIVDVLKDIPYLDELYAKLANFWAYVENMEEPPLTDDDFIERDHAWVIFAGRLLDVKERKKLLAIEEKEIETALRDLSENVNSRSGGIRYTCSTRKGAVNYAVIPELEGIDLDQYRKDSTKTWTLKAEKQ